jgi:PKD domain
LLVALGLVAASLVPVAGASAAAQCPDGQPCVVVHWMGTNSGTEVVTLADIDLWHDLTSVQYQTRVANSPPRAEPHPLAALSIRTLLANLTPHPAVTYTEALSPSGWISTLTTDTDDLGQPTDAAFPFEDGLMPAIFVVGPNESIGYIRPLRDDNDVNGNDFWQTNESGALELNVHTSGQLLTPTLHAKTKATTGTPLAFSASFDQPVATKITYTWTFGGGATRVTSTPSTTHVYEATGTYVAQVSIRGADSSSGSSQVVQIRVGKPPKPPKPHPGKPTPGSGTNHDPHAPATGPNHSSGGNAGGVASLIPRQSTPSRAPVGVASPAPTHPPVAPSTVSGTLVHGVVISNVDTLAAGAAPHSASAPAARQSRLAHRSLVFAWVLLVPLLLGLGAARESRWVAARRGRFRAGR